MLLYLVAGEYTSDPWHYESGRAWLLTPVKSWFIILNLSTGSQSHPWYTVPFRHSGDNYIDLRVVAIYLCIMLAGCLVYARLQRSHRYVGTAALAVCWLICLIPFVYAEWGPLAKGASVPVLMVLASSLMAAGTIRATRRPGRPASHNPQYNV